MHYQETKYGFNYGAAKIERNCSDTNKGWVCLGVTTPKVTLSIYVTKTGKVRIHDQKTRKELLPVGDPETLITDGKTETNNHQPASRLTREAQDTAARLNKLNAFMGSDVFPTLDREDKDLLYEQQRAMSKYVQILGKRLERQGVQFSHTKQV